MVSIEEAAAIERFVLNSTVPLVYNRDDAAVLAGSGTLFVVEDKYFVVTARHIFDERGCLKLWRRAPIVVRGRCPPAGLGQKQRLCSPIA